MAPKDSSKSPSTSRGESPTGTIRTFSRLPTRPPTTVTEGVSDIAGSHTSVPEVHRGSGVALRVRRKLEWVVTHYEYTLAAGLVTPVLNATVSVVRAAVPDSVTRSSRW